jgi:hypothetical protein
MIQTAQRIGMSLGTAIAATLFFGHLSAARGDYPAAASNSLYGAAALAALALVIATTDLTLNRRPRDSDITRPTPPSPTGTSE